MTTSGQSESEVLQASDWVNFNNFEAESRVKTKFYFFDESANIDSVKKAFLAKLDVSGPFMTVVVSYFHSLRVKMDYIMIIADR